MTLALTNLGATLLVISIVLIIVLQLATLMTLIFNVRQQRLHGIKLRDLDVSDRASVAAKVVETSTELASRVAVSHGEMVKAIQANTEKIADAATAAQEAYREANNVNIKISDLNERLIEQHKEVLSKGKK